MSNGIPIIGRKPPPGQKIATPEEILEALELLLIQNAASGQPMGTPDPVNAIAVIQLHKQMKIQNKLLKEVVQLLRHPPP
tara:strand:- start:2373 stop:2612 length:240 start_codon:yes stop_codon:yes gene_type:complete